MMMQIPSIFEPALPSQAHEHSYWNNLHGASIGLALSSAIKQSKRPMLIIAPDSLFAAHLLDELHFFNRQTNDLLYFPNWETLPYDHFSPHQDIISERLSVLYRLPLLRQGVVITTVDTVLQRVCPRAYLDGHHLILKVGDTLQLDTFRTRLDQAGYRHVSQVREHGEFAIRGSIIDLFPMGSKHPYRIDLLDEEVDSIRLFAVDTQRTLEKIKEIRLLPAKEFPLHEAAIEHFRQQWRQHFSGNPLQSPLYQDISEGICAPGLEYYLPLFFEQTATLFAGHFINFKRNGKYCFV